MDEKNNVTKDIETIEDAGFDQYLSRNPYDVAPGQVSDSLVLDATLLGGGSLGKDAVIELGSGLIKIDGKNKRIVVNDGANDRIIIGYQRGGF